MKINFRLIFGLVIFSLAANSLSAEEVNTTHGVTIRDNNQISMRKPVVPTKVTCKTIYVDNTKPIYLLTPQKLSPVEAISRSREKLISEPFKVMMTLKTDKEAGINSTDPSWEIFSEYLVAKEFKEHIKKNGKYQLCRFNPESGPSWTEIVISED